MRPKDPSSILDSLGFRSVIKLGAGINAAVYQIDEDRIIKIGRLSKSEIKRLQDFLDTLAHCDLPFQIPRILGSGEIDGQSYTIERLVHGTALRHVYPTLSEVRQEGCIREILDALDILHKIELPGFFGERLLGDHGVIALSWDGFLGQKCLQAVEANADALRADFAEIDKAWKMSPHCESQ
jgi:serine/threonine protein kinase